MEGCPSLAVLFSAALGVLAIRLWPHLENLSLVLLDYPPVVMALYEPV
jgi:hypothetical protein